MKRLLIPLLSLGILIYIGDALLTLRANIALDNAKYAAGKLDPALSPKAEQKLSVELAEHAAGVAAALPQSHIHLANELRKEIKLETSLDAQIKLFCRALSEYGKALQDTPTNGAWLVSWANIRQLLGNVTCTEPFTQGDFRQASNLAIQSAPSDTRVIYAAAIISLWSGDTQESWKLFNTVLSYDINISQVQKEFILSQLTSPEAVRAVIPARFPQIQAWGDIFKNNYPRQFVEYASVFAALQIAAIESSVKEVEASAIPAKMHYDRMFSLLNLSANSDVRQRIDKELAVYLQRTGKPELSKLFAERSTLRELEMVRSSLPGDTRPQKGTFANWGKNETISFDEFYRSVGFFLPNNQGIHMLEIRSAREGDAISPALIKVYVSNDNDAWEELRGEITVKPVTLSGRSSIWIKVPADPHPYWKIHFASGNRDRTLVNSLELMLHAYGLSSRNK